MSKIVVAKLVRLGKDGDKFSQKMIAKTERINAKVDDEFIKEFNENWETSGRMYVINDKLTKERDESLNSKKEKKDVTKKEDPELQAAMELYFETFSSKPDSLLKTEDILKIIKKKEIKNPKK